MKKLLFILSLILIIAGTQSCSIFPGKYISKTERGIAGSSRKVGKVRESGKVRVAKSKQAKNQGRLKKQAGKATKASRSRTYRIQTDEVKARMKMNESRIAKREKLKDKRSKAGNKKAARKYR